MSQADPASPKGASGKRGKGVEALDRPSDRDSEGVYYMSVEDFERRIEPTETDVDTDASDDVPTQARPESETDSKSKKRS